MRDRGVREKIVSESTKLFLQKSFKGTSIKDITDAAHISKGVSIGTSEAKTSCWA